MHGLSQVHGVLLMYYEHLQHSMHMLTVSTQHLQDSEGDDYWVTSLE